MAGSAKIVRPIRWARLRTDEAKRLANTRAQDTDNVIIIGHPGARQEERSFIDEDIYDILRTGFVVKEPTKNDKGCWEFVVSKELRGGRDAGVAVIVCENSDKIIVKTCMWIDPRRAQ